MPEGQGRLFAIDGADTHAVRTFVGGLTNTNIHMLGPELIFGTLFQRMGFDDALPDPLFRHLVIARLVYPGSKLKTTDYLRRYRGITIGVDTIYRLLDTLQSTYKEKVERAAYEYTKAKQGGVISVVFYDMTTLYFEAQDEDDLRKIGFSKDGKFQCPQIMLGLLIGAGGYPIGYDIFEGNTFEGHTLLPTLLKIQMKYGFGKPTVVADAGLLSKDNIKKLEEGGYTFIIGARIKNETDAMKQRILEQHAALADGNTITLDKSDNTRLIVSFLEKRERKDAYMREKGLKRLRAKVANGKLTKAHINDRGYNKFLAMEGEVSVLIDEAKITEDARWDGLKGYVTNTTLAPEEVIAAYGNLWRIEKAFRISKTDLRVRPIFHRIRRRIEAHLCIAFVAYAIANELEHLLADAQVAMTAARAAELTHTMFALVAMLPGELTPTTTILQMDDEQHALYKVIHK
jgi:transposase